METLASRLAEARKNSGLTQGQAADKLHVTTQSVSSWETGNSIPDTDRLPEIAELYSVTTDWLLSGKRPSPEVVEITSHLSDRLFSEKRMSTYIGAYCNAKHLYQTRRALAFARDKHSGQFRKQGHTEEMVPYINHPLTMACHALAMGFGDDDLLSACLLHDVCEDCGVAPEELPVSEACREAVRLVTKPDDFQKTAEDERAYYTGIGDNRIATIVKLLDRCHNISGMATCFSDKRMAEYIKETQNYIWPLMSRARDLYPEYSNQLFLIRYHMNSVLEALKHHMWSSM